MGWDTEDCIKYFYKEYFRDDLPGLNVKEDGHPPFDDLNREQYEVVEKAYWHDWELERSHNDLYSTPR